VRSNDDPSVKVCGCCSSIILATTSGGIIIDIVYVLCHDRALRIRRKLILSIEDDVQRCLSEIVLVFVVMILFNSALMEYLEPDQELAFHTWMYYMLVTVASKLWCIYIEAICQLLNS
jgi:hypothetical protein